MELLKFFFRYFIRLMQDQSGEANLDGGDDDPDADGDPGNDDPDDDPDDDPNEDPDITLELGEGEGEGEGDDKDDKDEKEDAEQKGIIESLTKQVRDLEKIKDTDQDFITKLKAQVNTMRGEIDTLKQGGTKEDPVKFTDQQLLNIMKEHDDDPAVMLQVIKQAVKQETADIKPDIENAAELTGKKKDSEDYLTATWPEWKTDATMQSDLNQAKQYLNVTDHPLADFMAMGTIVLNQLPEIIKTAKEEGKKEALGEKGEAARKSKIKTNKLSGGGKPPAGKKESLTDSETEAMKVLGIKPGSQQAKIYTQMLKKGKAGTQAVEV